VVLATAAAIAGSRFGAEAQPRPKPRAIGGAGTSVLSGHIQDLDASTEVRGANWYGRPSQLGIADKMLTDAHVRKAVDAIVDPIVGATWDVEPGGPSDVEKEAADYLRWNLLERLRWGDVLREHLTLLSHGFSLHEVTDDVVSVSTSRFPRHPGEGTGIAITGIYDRPQQTITGFTQQQRSPHQLWKVEQTLVGSDVENSAVVEIFADRLLRGTWGQRGARFSGFAPLRSAHPPWKIKKLLTLIEAIFHERTGSGLPSISQTEREAGGEDQLEDALGILAEVRANEKGFLYLPWSYEFAWNTIDGKMVLGIGTTIERCNRDIAYNLNTAWMLTGTSPGGAQGSYALSANQRPQYEIAVANYLAAVEDDINLGRDGWSIAERITQQNYGTGVAPPRVVARNIPTTDWSRSLPMIYNLTLANQLTADDRTEGMIRTVLRLPQRDPATARPRSPLGGGVAGQPSPDSALEETTP
jgi:hypothetical protein